MNYLYLIVVDVIVIIVIIIISSSIISGGFFLPPPTTISVVLIVGFEVLTVVTRKSTIFWGVMPCSLVEVHQRFGEAYCLYLQGRRVSQARNHEETSPPLVAVLLAGLVLGPKDGGRMVLQNSSGLLPDNLALHLRG
jgi:hypothetical protein